MALKIVQSQLSANREWCIPLIYEISFQLQTTGSSVFVPERCTILQTAQLAALLRERGN